MDESNGEEKTEPISESESSAKGLSPGTVFNNLSSLFTRNAEFSCVIEKLPRGLCHCSLSISQFDGTASTIK